MDVWDIYFSGIVGWQMHPGYLREGAKPLSLEECAQVATDMVKEREKWRTPAQQLQQ